MGFVSSVIIAGVLVFVAAIVAGVAQKARTMGAPPLIPRIAAGAAFVALGVAVYLFFSSFSSLPGPEDAGNDAYGRSDVEKIDA
jgi:hypothetical protein